MPTTAALAVLCAVLVIGVPRCHSQVGLFPPSEAWMGPQRGGFLVSSSFIFILHRYPGRVLYFLSMSCFCKKKILGVFYVFFNSKALCLCFIFFIVDHVKLYAE